LNLLSLLSVLYETKREGNELGEIGYSFRGEIKTPVQVANRSVELTTKPEPAKKTELLVSCTKKILLKIYISDVLFFFICAIVRLSAHDEVCGLKTVLSAFLAGTMEGYLKSGDRVILFKGVG